MGILERMFSEGECIKVFLMKKGDVIIGNKPNEDITVDTFLSQGMNVIINGTHEYSAHDFIYVIRPELRTNRKVASERTN